MQPTTFEIVFPLTVLVFLGALVPVGIMVANALIHPQRKGPHSKGEPYECGLGQTAGSATERYSIKYYLVAMLFLVFDLEVAFLYPWTLRFLKGGWTLLWILLAFLAILEAGYFYLWRKGALDWND
ncbi:MAG TPA: NADH-quinone oxidoreductase subunit A [Fibrobacteraceae bacterium]|nr:NADH-quinone oxidoreductase subunit A [Fibrobacteraceae bacterium]